MQASRIASLRAALFAEARPADIRLIARRLIDKAQAGSIPAARLIFHYLLADPVPIDILAKIEVLEQTFLIKGGRA